MEKRAFGVRMGKSQNPKSKANLPSGSFIALGARQTGSESGSHGSFKRDSSSAGSSVGGLQKKIRLSKDSSATAKELTQLAQAKAPPQLWQSYASDVEPLHLFKCLAVEEGADAENARKAICGAMKLLCDNRLKHPDPLLSTVLCYAAREKPWLFDCDHVLQAMVSMLRKAPPGKGMAAGASGRSSQLASAIVCNVLAMTLAEKSSWPDSLVYAYLDDSLSDRLWVDQKDAACLVSNIQTAFGTELPSSGFIDSVYADLRTQTDQLTNASSTMAGDEEDNRSRDSTDSAAALTGGGGEAAAARATVSDRMRVAPRFQLCANEVQEYATKLLVDFCARRVDGAPRSLLKTFIACCGVEDVRLLASQKLDGWLQNGKLQRVALELLTAVCVNCKTLSPSDVEVINNVLRLRLKTKIITSCYFAALKVLFTTNVESLPLVLRLAVHNELSVSRSLNNLSLIGQCLQHDASRASQVLATLFLDFLTHKEDYLRALRTLLREIVRSAPKTDFPVVDFAHALMVGVSKLPNAVDKLDAHLKERLFHAVEDLLCLCVFASIPSQVRDLMLPSSRGEKKDANVMIAFREQYRRFQAECISWLKSFVPSFFKLSKEDYIRSFYRLLFLDKPDFYSGKDSWPAEPERNLCLKIVAEFGVCEETMRELLSTTQKGEMSLSSPVAIDITEQLLRRLLCSSIDAGLLLGDPSLIDLLFDLCMYRPPENIALPARYKPVPMAITGLYWKVWLILTMLACHNAHMFGSLLWNRFPIGRMLMEIIISDEYAYPPSTSVMESGSAEEMLQKELQICEREKQEILELEGFLAAASTKQVIHERNSLLISQLTQFNPTGFARKPPQPVLDQLKAFALQMNLRLRLCSSRDPDFLLAIINRQGASQALPWLAAIIEQNENSLALLPVECLCEFLFNQIDVHRQKSDHCRCRPFGVSSPMNEQNFGLERIEQLATKLRQVVTTEQSDCRQATKALIFFLNRLQATACTDRAVAIKALDMIIYRPGSEKSVDRTDGTAFQWLLQRLPTLPCFPKIRKATAEILLQCLLIETDISLLHAYVEFLSQRMAEKADELDLEAACLIFAKMIYCRQNIFSSLIPLAPGDWRQKPTEERTLNVLLEVFACYLKQTFQARTDHLTWSASQDKLLVQWGESTCAILDAQVVAAMLLLLTPTPPRDRTFYDQLFQSWFAALPKPAVFLLDTTEEADLITDQLCVLMLRSHNDQLVQSVLDYISEAQLLLCLQTFGLYPENVSKLLQMLDRLLSQQADFAERHFDGLRCIHASVVAYRSLGAVGGERYLDWYDRLDIEDVKPVLSRIAVLKALPTEAAGGDADEAMDVVAVGDQQRISVTDVDRVLSALFFGDCARNMDACADFARISCALTAGGQATTAFPSSAKLASYAVDWLSEKLSQSSKLSRALKSNPARAFALFHLLNLVKNASVRKKFVELCQMVLAKNSDVGTELWRFCKAVAVGKARTATSSLLEDVRARRKMLMNFSKQSFRQHLRHLSVTAMDCEESRCFRRLLLLADPEIVTALTDLQISLIFRKTSPPVFRHLSNLMSHCIKMSSLKRVIDCLLSAFNDQFDEQQVLNFLCTVFYVSRMCPGSSCGTATPFLSADPFELSGDQLMVLTQYVLAEFNSYFAASDGGPASSQQVAPSSVGQQPRDAAAAGAPDPATAGCVVRRHDLQDRMDFFLVCCSNERRLKMVVNRLHDEWKKLPSNRASLEQFLTEIYFKRPAAIKWLENVNFLQRVIQGVHSQESQVDIVLHHLLCELEEKAKDAFSDQKMTRIKCVLYRFAAFHPTLFVRQLPLIAALLRGKTDYSMQHYSTTNYLLFYTIILDLLEFISPYPFDRLYVDSFMDIMSSFFEFMEKHALKYANLVVLLDKVLIILKNHNAFDAEVAIRFLQNNTQLIQALSVRYPALTSLHSLIEQVTLPLPSLTSNWKARKQVTDKGVDLKPSLVRAPSPVEVPEVSLLYSRLIKAHQTEEISDLLFEFEEKIKSKPDVLRYFKPAIEHLLSYSSANVRVTAFSLLLRYLSQDPRDVESAIVTVLRCLSHPDNAVAQTAMENLADFIGICSDEYVGRILDAEFQCCLRNVCDSFRALAESTAVLHNCY